ncbi:MAG: hypothetical protein GY940_46110, partial [bacterium]|nr:hypothetical protein [bacterium]
MPGWKKSTVLTNGIFVYSLFLFIWGIFSGFGFSTERRYQAQFFTTQLQGKLDYDRLKKIGIQGIIYRVFLDNEQNGGLYFTNTRFHTIEPALESLIAELDKGAFNLELCAWMIGRKFKWISNANMLDYQYENGERRRIRKLDIFNPEALQKLIDVYRDLASRKIDRILIQDDLTLRYNEGFSNWGKAKFTGVTGVPAKEKLMMRKNTPYNKNWNRVKISQLNKVLKWIVQSCKKVNSGIKVGMNIYYETPIFTKKSEAWYSHNLGELLETGIDDI